MSVCRRGRWSRPGASPRTCDESPRRALGRTADPNILVAIRGLRANRVVLVGSVRSTKPGNRPGLDTSMRSSKISTRMWSPATLYERWTTALTTPSSHAASGMSATLANVPADVSARRPGCVAAMAARALRSKLGIGPSIRMSLINCWRAPDPRSVPRKRSTRRNASGRNSCGFEANNRHPAIVSDAPFRSPRAFSNRLVSVAPAASA